MRLLLASAILMLAGCNQDRIAMLEKENKELRAKLDSARRNGSLELQEKCSNQARLEYKNGGWEKHQDVQNGESSSFTNHYNSKYNICFMELTSERTVGINGLIEISTHRTVTDAFEGRVYAGYIWMSQKGKKYWEVAPRMCSVTPVGGKEITCSSTEEYELLIKQFMEQ